MAETMRLFVLAGEPSGDRIGADLVQKLRRTVSVELSGVGGEDLNAQGLCSLYPMADLAVMGVFDVLKRLPLLLWRVRQTAQAIVAAQPDIVVLIDAQDFSRLVAKRLRALGYTGPVLLYVAPSVWGRAPERAAKLAPLFDEVLAVLPFEPKVMRDLGGPPTSYVGHPALTEVQPYQAARDSGLIALLPGSRRGELRRHLPMLRAVARQLSTQPGVTGFFIPTLQVHATRLRGEIADWGVPMQIVEARADRAELYRQTLMAVSVAGTATLELAFAGVPMVLTYVMDRPQAIAFERLGRPLVGLPSIIARRLLSPELVMATANPSQLVSAAQALVQDKAARQSQIEAFAGLIEVMREGTGDAPRQDPADRVLQHWRPGQRAPIAS